MGSYHSVEPIDKEELKTFNFEDVSSSTSDKENKKKKKIEEETEKESSSSSSAASSSSTSPSSSPPRIPLVYSPHYNISFFHLESLHPFDAGKYGRVMKELQERWRNLLAEWIYQPVQIPVSVLRLVHTEEYMRSLTSSINVARIMELPPLAV